MKRPAAAAAADVDAGLRKKPAADRKETKDRVAKMFGNQDPIAEIFAGMLKRMPPKDLKELRKRVRQMVTVPICSGCSGSNVATVCLAVFLEVLGEGQVRDLFVCEKDFA